MAIDEIYQQMKAKKGYGVKTHLDKSLAVYDFATESVARYGSFDDLPEHIASKYAVFHVLEDNEPQPSVGVKFPENYCYIVS
jgi:hypothetical protein